MEQLIIAIVVIYFVGAAIYVAYQYGCAQSPSADNIPPKEAYAEQIMGKCLYDPRQSKPQVTTYTKSDVIEKSRHTFASENQDKGIYFEDIDEVKFETDEEDIDYEQEERAIAQSAKAEDEIASGVDLVEALDALKIIGKEKISLIERQRSFAVLSKLKNTDIVNQLRKDPKRSMRIDQIINSHFEKEQHYKENHLGQKNLLNLKTKKDERN